MNDLYYMQIAMEEAHSASDEDEVPVGSVLEYGGKILSRDHNRMIQRKDSLAHAELITLLDAAKKHPERWLLDSTLYVTLEPCAMCAGALVLARVKRLVFGAPDSKAGACGSTLNIVQSNHLNHRVEVMSGVLQMESAQLLVQFFQSRRQ